MVFGPPNEASVVTVAYREEATRAEHPSHLLERRYRTAQVLEDLVSVDHVEASGLPVERVHVPDREGHVVHPLRAGVGSGLCDYQRLPVHAEDPPGSDDAGEVDGDGARSAADVEDVHTRTQMVEKVTGRVFGGTPPMAAQHGLLVAMRIDVLVSPGGIGLGHQGREGSGGNGSKWWAVT